MTYLDTDVWQYCGGLNASKETQRNARKQLEILDVRLNSVKQQDSVWMRQIEDFKQQVNSLRTDNLIFERQSTKLRALVGKATLRTTGIMKQSNAVHEDVLRYKEEQRLLRKRNDMDREKWMKEMEKLGKFIKEEHEK